MGSGQRILKSHTELRDGPVIFGYLPSCSVQVLEISHPSANVVGSNFNMAVKSHILSLPLLPARSKMCFLTGCSSTTPASRLFYTAARVSFLRNITRSCPSLAQKSRGDSHQAQNKFKSSPRCMETQALWPVTLPQPQRSVSLLHAAVCHPRR